VGRLVGIQFFTRTGGVFQPGEQPRRRRHTFPLSMAPVPMRIGDVLLLVAAPSHRAIPSPTRQSQALLRLAGPFAFHFVAAYVVSANWSLCDTASCVGGWSDPARGAPPCAARSVLALRGGSLELQLPERDAELLPPVDVDGEDANGGLWRWEMPDENTALRAWGDALEDYTADSPRKCMYCQETMVVQGVSAAALNGSWVAFFCRECAPHLSVRKNAQVPVTWGAEANETLGLLTMLPLYKRCRRCRRWATWGPKTHPRRALHCKAHKLPLEEDVVHRRHLCQAENCTRRPSFAEPSHKARPAPCPVTGFDGALVVPLGPGSCLSHPSACSASPNKADPGVSAPRQRWLSTKKRPKFCAKHSNSSIHVGPSL
jgi:hypothetical protein